MLQVLSGITSRGGNAGDEWGFGLRVLTPQGPRYVCGGNMKHNRPQRSHQGGKHEGSAIRRRAECSPGPRIPACAKPKRNLITVRSTSPSACCGTRWPMRHSAKGNTFQNMTMGARVVLFGMCQEKNERTIGSWRSDLGHQVRPLL
jgi:hypothetical protein